MFNYKKIRNLKDEIGILNNTIKINLERYKDLQKEIYELKNVTRINNNRKVYCKDCYWFTSYLYISCNSPFNEYIKENFKSKENIKSIRPEKLNEYNNCNMFLDKNNKIEEENEN